MAKLTKYVLIVVINLSKKMPKERFNRIFSSFVQATTHPSITIATPGLSVRMSEQLYRSDLPVAGSGHVPCSKVLGQSGPGNSSTKNTSTEPSETLPPMTLACGSVDTGISKCQGLTPVACKSPGIYAEINNVNCIDL